MSGHLSPMRLQGVLMPSSVSITLSRDLDDWLDRDARQHKCRGKAERFEQILRTHPADRSIGANDLAMINRERVGRQRNPYPRTIALGGYASEQLTHLRERQPAHMRPALSLIAAWVILCYKERAAGY